MVNFDNKLMRIGVFYDGNYFFHVSNYYNYEHPRKARLSVSGLHDFIRHQVAKAENTDTRLCQVVDSHYFRGRLSSYEAEGQNKLLSERIFDDILMNEGVVTHYLPLKNREGKYEEKGIDVWLALEAFELSIYKKFNVVVLVASDGDYVPLIRKLNTLGIRVMVLAWDFEYADDRTGKLKKTTTSIELLEEVTYPIPMQEVIENKVNRNDPVVNGLFVARDLYSNRPRVQENISINTETTKIAESNNFVNNVVNNNVVANNIVANNVVANNVVANNVTNNNVISHNLTQNQNSLNLQNQLQNNQPQSNQPQIFNNIPNNNIVANNNNIITPTQTIPTSAQTIPTISHIPTTPPVSPVMIDLNLGIIRSSVHSLKNGYGFITYPPNNLFFHWRNLLNTDFHELKEGEIVDFKIKRGEKGDDVAYDVTMPDRDSHYYSSFTLANAVGETLVFDEE
jgi:cold shock CspA family protein/uncharacterized LabA/DUF88 family protein